MDKLPFEIRESEDAFGGIQIELWIEDERLARATAPADKLDDMRVLLGLEREAVAEELRHALKDLLKGQLGKVSISDLARDPDKPLSYRARYTYRDHDEVETGVVSYDVDSAATGPEGLPATVRNKMRHVVHQELTGVGSAARALVDIHE